MKNIIFIPLDSRPCNTAWIEQLAHEAGLKLLMYPRHLTGTLHKGANFNGMMSMIENNIKNCEYLIISSDGLASGGLVQGRLGLIDVNQRLSQLTILKEYKEIYPNLKIYVFDTLMRTSITTYDNESSIYWTKVNDYSNLVGEYYYSLDIDIAKKIEDLEKEIPERILKQYLKARDIKHRLNMFFLECVKDDIIDYLIILQEDTSPIGIQKIEQEKIHSFINNNKLSKKVKTYNGTDEGGLLLLGKVINQLANIKPKIYVHLPYPNALERVMHFEDRPVIENLTGMFDTIGFEFCSNAEDADFILAIYTERENKYLNLNRYKDIPPIKNKEYKLFIKTLNTYLKEGKRLAFVDLFFPNGGSLDILEDINYQELKVYSAWNTASNSLGSALCEIAVLCANKNSDHNSFKNERILDDCVYQYIVRRHINKEALVLGYNIYDLGEKGVEITIKIIEAMAKYQYLVENKKFIIDLPWNRTFEIDIKMEE